MAKTRMRITAAILALVLSLACVLSSNVIARLHHHDCAGEHCATCHTIAGAASELSAAATVSSAVCLLLVAAGSYVARVHQRRATYGEGALTLPPRTPACAAQTPVSLKVLLLI